jgi:hypothetical protein
MNEENSPSQDIIDDAENLLAELDGISPVSVERSEEEQEEEEQEEIEIQEEEEEEYEEEEELCRYEFYDEDIVIITESSSTDCWPLGEVVEITPGYNIATNNENSLVQLRNIRASYGHSDRRYSRVSDIREATEKEIADHIVKKELELQDSLRKSKEVAKSNEKNIVAMKKSLTEMFDDNWDIVETITNNKYALSLVLKFPEITIKNGRAGKKTLYDLYIKVEFDENLTVTSRMQGRRGAITYSEYISGYRHSHLPSSSCSSENMENMCGWKDFCLGSSEMSAIQRDWQVDRNSVAGEPFSIIQFELFMYQIEAYAGWESLGGGPYIRMENVHNYEGVTKIHNRILNNIYGNEIKNLKEFKVSFDNSKNRFIVDLEELEATLTKMDISVDRVQKTRDGSYIYSNNASLQLILSKISNQNIKFLVEDEESNAFLFRNKPAPTYILEYNVKEDTSTAEEVVHPDLTKYFSNKLESHINHYFIKKYGK